MVKQDIPSDRPVNQPSVCALNKSSGAQQEAPLFIRSGELCLNVQLHGVADGAPVLLVHGTALTNESFAESAAGLSDTCLVITPDVRGHGDSDWHPESRYTHADCVQDFKSIIEALAITEPVRIVGHSISGLHAARFAAENPELVESVVLVDLLPEVNDEILKHVFAFVQREFASLEDAVKSVKSSGTEKDEAEIAAALQVVMTHDSDRNVYRYKSDPAFVREFYNSDLLSFWHSIAAVQCPLTLVLGEKSTVVPDSAVQQFRALHPEATVVTVGGAKHNVMSDNPAGFVAVLREVFEV